MMQDIETIAPTARASGRVWRIVRIGVVVYLLLCLMFSMLQTSMIFPGRATQGQRHAQYRPGAFEELIELKTARGERVAALFTPALHENPSTRPTVLFFYGNAMCLADSIGMVRDFRALGFNVMVPDYLGYGMSGGEASEQGFYETAQACWEHLESRGDVDARKIVPVGLSVGGGAAIELASRKKVAGVVTISAFTSLDDMARSILPWFPTKLLLRHHFRNEEKLRSMDMPHLILHGQRDTIVPVEMAHKLHAASRRSTLLILPAADHNDSFEVAGDEMFAAMGRFIEACGR